MMPRLRLPLLLALAGCGGATATPAGSSSTSSTTSVLDTIPLPTTWDDPSTTSIASATSDPSGAADSTTGAAVDEPDWREQIIYLALPDRFVDGDPSNDMLVPEGCFDPDDPRRFHGGDLVGLRDHVGYLGELGVTTLWITPVYLQTSDRCGYHGYWADFADPDDGAMQPSLGTPDELVELADTLHAADMRLVLDMVVNHAGPTARVLADHPTWFHDPSDCGDLGPAEVYCPIGGSPLPDFAQEQPEVADYLDAMTLGWIERAPIDGIRMDTVKHVPVEYWAEHWIPAVASVRPELYVVGEVFDTGSTEKLAQYLDAGFPSLFNFPLMAELVHVFGGGGSVDPLADRLREQLDVLGQSRLRALTSFVDNHDLPRLASVVDADPAEIHRRQLLALGALLTLPGVPMLYYGDELGLLGGNDPDNRRDMPSWAFTPEGRAIDHPGEALPGADETFARVRDLIALRREHPALVHGDYVELWRKGGQAANIFAFYRRDASDPIIVAINNAGATAGPIAIRIAHNPALTPADLALVADGSAWVDLLGAGAPATVTISEGELTIELPPRTMGVYGRSQR